jgi:WxL domain surface cell wall-binding
MRNFLSHLPRKTLTVIVVGVVTLAAATSAIAGTVTATATVNGAGSLGLAHGATAAIGTVTIDGSDQTVAYTIPLSITDARGNGAGWNATITSTSFNDGAGHTLATTSSSVSAVTVACVAGGSCTNPTNAVAYALAVPAGATAPTGVKLFDGAVNTGMGRFTVTPTINVGILGNVYAGTYNSTVTVAVATGP